MSRRCVAEYAADRRAYLSRDRLPARWRPWMKQWTAFRGAAWKIDHRWSTNRLIGHSGTLKARGEWVPLSDAAPAEIILIDECVADLVGCTVVSAGGDRDYWAHVRRNLWSQSFYDPDIDPDWDEDLARRVEEEDRRLEEKIDAAREREGDLLLMHYLLPHVRLYGKLRALDLSERAYYYRLDSALSTLDQEYSFRADHLNNVQS